MIFVFGSNTAGIHGAGAAEYARENKGAILGQGEGLQGDSYAIPTKNKFMQPLTLPQIHWFVAHFLNFAQDNPDLKFQVTQVGCGLAGHKACEIAAMFHGAPDNCYFDKAWEVWLGSDYNYWGTK